MKCFISCRSSMSFVRVIWLLKMVYRPKGTENAMQRSKIFEPSGFASASAIFPFFASIIEINKSGMLDAEAA